MSTNSGKFKYIVTSLSIHDITYYLFWIGFICVFTSSTFSTMYFQNILSGGVLSNIGIMFLVIKILLDIFFSKGNKLILYISTLISGVLAMFSSGENTLLVLFVVVIAASNISYTKIVKFVTYLLCGLFTINIILVALGLKLPGMMLDNAKGHDGSIRYFLGFEFPNRAMMMYTNTLLCLILLFKEKLSSFVILFYIILAGVVYYYTEARGGLIVFAITVALFLAGKTKLKQVAIKYQLANLSALLIVVIMFLSSLVLDGQRKMNIPFFSTFESRMIALGKLKNEVNITLFGGPISDLYPVDCVYFKMLLYYGVIPFIIFFLLYFIAANRNRNDYYWGIVLIAMAFIGVIQIYPLELYYSLPMLAAFSSNTEVISTSSQLVSPQFASLKSYAISSYIGAIFVLLIGHSIIQHNMEQAELIGTIYNGPINPQITDIIFVLLGIILGVVVSAYTNNNETYKLHKK